MPDPRPLASSIDLRCCCGATLFVESQTDPYERVVDLGKAFISAHQKCAGLDYQPRPITPRGRTPAQNNQST
jgi:hypothetical protein